MPSTSARRLRISSLVLFILLTEFHLNSGPFVFYGRQTPSYLKPRFILPC
ncbi:hypothetical protein B0H13DRAFT_2362910 [Mycena leptocephala]|nr:hypothetical protein B0H13DRAFT_2362910 [Mycena leptocephala]